MEDKSYEELFLEKQNLNKQITDLIAPLKKKENALRELLDKAFFEVQKKFFEENVSGKLFYVEGYVGLGYEKAFRLIKPISCNDFGTYNSCKSIEIDLQINENGFFLMCKPSSHRVDDFGKNLIELTPELLEFFKSKVNTEIQQSLANFIAI